METTENSQTEESLREEQFETDTAEEAAVPPVPLPDISPVSPLPERRMPTIPQLALALGALALIFVFSYFPIGTERNTQKKSDYVPEQIRDEAQQIIEIAPFEEITVTANAAYVWDVKNQRALYNKNAGAQLPLASLTKLMTALAAYEYLDTEDQVSITTQALLQEGDSKLSRGETFALRDLIDFTLITSSNDGAYALAAAAGATLSSGENVIDVFVDAMNARAEKIGLSQSYFTNPTGLDIDGLTSGSYGSARDMAFLMEYLVLQHPQILEGTREPESIIYDHEGVDFMAVNTNEITAAIPGLIGSKTGFTSLAGGNLVIAYDAGFNRPIIISVLGSTRDGRFTDVMALIEETGRVLASE